MYDIKNVNGEESEEGRGEGKKENKMKNEVRPGKEKMKKKDKVKHNKDKVNDDEVDENTAIKGVFFLQTTNEILWWGSNRKIFFN